MLFAISLLRCNSCCKLRSESLSCCEILCVNHENCYYEFMRCELNSFLIVVDLMNLVAGTVEDWRIRIAVMVLLLLHMQNF